MSGVRLPASNHGHLDILCLSHLRWNWVFQRPQHLLTRAAASRRVFFFEEPIFETDSAARLQLSCPHARVTVATPVVPSGLRGAPLAAAVQRLLDLLIAQQGIDEYLSWYYTPMALQYSRHLTPVATVYDCMDQLSAFAGAPPEMLSLERELLSRSDVVFTGGHSLFEAKQRLHPHVYCFPSSVDVSHFMAARTCTVQPADQESIPRPRLGYCGVIDERLDLSLIASLAEARPRWHLVLVGPVTKVEERLLPSAANIHYLGAKSYESLPGYVAGWDVGLMPFARNEATRYISPTKTPEYLAAGKPVISTSIRDVVRSYGEPGFVRIADDLEPFIRAVEECLLEDPLVRLRKVDALLGRQSWDKTWSGMQSILDRVSAPIGLSAKAA